jgi:hypothetical protein
MIHNIDLVRRIGPFFHMRTRVAPAEDPDPQHCPDAYTHRSFFLYASSLRKQARKGPWRRAFQTTTLDSSVLSLQLSHYPRALSGCAWASARFLWTV